MGRVQPNDSVEIARSGQVLTLTVSPPVGGIVLGLVLGVLALGGGVSFLVASEHPEATRNGLGLLVIGAVVSAGAFTGFLRTRRVVMDRSTDELTDETSVGSIVLARATSPLRGTEVEIEQKRRVRPVARPRPLLDGGGDGVWIVWLHPARERPIRLMRTTTCRADARHVAEAVIAFLDDAETDHSDEAEAVRPSDPAERALADRLVSARLLRPGDLESCLLAQRARGGPAEAPLAEVLVEKGHVSADDVAEASAALAASAKEPPRGLR